MRITVIVTDVASVVCAGGNAELRTRTFDAPPELAEFIDKTKRENTYVTFALAIEEPQP